MANATRAAEAQTETMRLYRSFWNKGRGGTMELQPSRKESIGLSMVHLAMALDKKMSRMLLEVYEVSLADLEPAEIIQAFSRAHDELKYFPPPATLREFSGRAVTGDPIAAEAKSQLLYVLEGMRGPHGPMLRDIPGKVLYGTEDDPKDKSGMRVVDAIRAESTPFVLSRRLEAALVRIGWGDRSAGIAMIADHPALSRKSRFDDDDQFKKNQLRAADEILKRFTDAYREV